MLVIKAFIFIAVLKKGYGRKLINPNLSKCFQDLLKLDFKEESLSLKLIKDFKFNLCLMNINQSNLRIKNDMLFLYILNIYYIVVINILYDHIRFINEAK